MKKKWKYMILTFVFLIAAVGGYFLYILKFKEYDVADKQVEKIVEENYVLELPDGTKLEVDSEGNIVQDAINNASATNNNTVLNSQSTTSNNLSNNQTTTNNTTTAKNEVAPAEQPTVASIKAKYEPTLQALEAQAATKISGLVGRAKNEYVTKQANGESIDIGYFYSKYTAAAKNLEASTDAVFNSLISIIEQDLQANGFDQSYAQDIRDQYEAAKEARRNELLNQVKGAM